MIPEAAVQAAMEAFLLESSKRKGELSEKPFALLAALEAAAPHMRSSREKSFDVPTEPDDGLLDRALNYRPTP